jgi:ubiquinone/menaquinone biosynthesis C-methylase UbiE
MEKFKMTNEVSNFFDNFSKDYDQFAFEKSIGTKYLSDIETGFILENLQIENRKILDVGVGTGRNSELLLTKGGIIEGIDISEGMMAKAKQKLKGGKINFTVADAGEKIPFEDSTFDIIICTRVLKYIPTWKNAISEFSRVLKKDGTLILEIANMFSVQYFGLYDSNYFLFNPNVVKKVLKENGFEIMQISCGTRLPFPLYSRVNNEHVLNSLIVLESFLDKLMPKTALSRNILLKCKKV